MDLSGKCHRTLECGDYLGGGEEVKVLGDGPSSEAVGGREDSPAREIGNKGG